MLPPDRTSDNIRTGNNIGAVRYVLALAVFVAHFNLLAGADFHFPLTSYQGVCGFFTISGFLIFKSFRHCGDRVGHYLYSRAVRILPSYVAVVVAATVLLSAVSTLGVSDYFSSGDTWRYLAANLCFANFVQPALPGVFDASTVTDAVNGSLWTMKVEWALYLTVPLAAWLIYRRGMRAWVVIVTVYLFSAAYRVAFWWLYYHTDAAVYDIVGRQFFGQLTYFYLGVLLYCYFDRVKRLLPYIGLAALAAVILASQIGAGPSVVYRGAVEPLFLATIVLALGLTGNWGGGLARFTDCSYEIYLFHFPVIQLVVTGGASCLPMAGQCVVALGVTVVVSYLCARFVSDPLRRRFRR